MLSLVLTHLTCLPTNLGIKKDLLHLPVMHIWCGIASPPDDRIRILEAEMGQSHKDFKGDYSKDNFCTKLTPTSPTSLQIENLGELFS